MKSLFLIVFLVFPCFLYPSPLESLEEILDSSSFSVTEKNNIIKEFTEASDSGIPESFLIPRLKEGIAKKVPFHILLTALKREKDVLIKSRSMLESAGYGKRPEHRDWIRTAHLILTGLSGNEVETLLETFTSRQPDYRQGTTLYLSLVRWGIKKQQALELVSAAASSRIPGDSFSGIIDILTTARQLRISTEDVILRLVKVLPDSDSIELLKEIILY